MEIFSSNNASSRLEMENPNSIFNGFLHGIHENNSQIISDWLLGFNALSDITTISFAVVDCNSGEIIYAGQKFCELMCGSNTSDGYPTNIFNHFVFQEDLIQLKKDVCPIGKVVDKEIQMMNGKGEFFLASFSAAQLKIHEQKVFVIVVNDIGEQKIIEEEKERLLEELEVSKEQIEEEAGKLAGLNVQLEESERKLTELNASKDKLFSIIGHDLKNPFFVISSYAEILNEEYDSLSEKEKKEFIEVIKSTSSFAQKLLENLLDWARSQTGRIEFIPEPLQLKRIVDNSFQLLKSQAMKKSINLVYDVESSIIVSADKNMLDTIFRNLISNAIKFTNENGTVAVLIDETDESIHVKVKDTGIGMSESDLNKLFRIDVNNTEIGSSKEKGTGLGLILCKEFVERHSGKIWVESTLGKGSTFNFTIPKLVEKNHD